MSKNSFDSKATKRVSFLLATKNRAKYLEKTLIIHQTLIGLNDELIIIDGNSTDQTLSVINKYKKIVSLFVSEDDISESHATNKGVLLASGKYIKILTDDDTFYKEAIEEAIEVMEENPDIDVLLCGGTKARGRRKWNAYAPPGVNYGKEVADVFRYGGCGLGMIIKRSAFSLTGLFSSESLSLDNDYLAKAIYSGAKVKFCRINMFHHPLEDHSAAVNRTEKLFKDRERLMKQYGLQNQVLLQKIRISAASMIFPLLPKFIQNPYKKFIKNKRQALAIKPIWDGGFS